MTLKVDRDDYMEIEDIASSIIGDNCYANDPLGKSLKGKGSTLDEKCFEALDYLISSCLFNIPKQSKKRADERDVKIYTLADVIVAEVERRYPYLKRNNNEEKRR